MAASGKSSSDIKTKMSQQDEKILNMYQALLEERRQIATKLAEIDSEENELKVVVNTLEKVDGNRKCYRLIGGVLCEKTVKDVLPVLLKNKEEVTRLQAETRENLVKKSVEINEFAEKHNIRLQGQDDNVSSAGDRDSCCTTAGVLAKA